MKVTFTGSAINNMTKGATSLARLPFYVALAKQKNDVGTLEKMFLAQARVAQAANQRAAAGLNTAKTRLSDQQFGFLNGVEDAYKAGDRGLAMLRLAAGGRKSLATPKVLNNGREGKVIDETGNIRVADPEAKSRFDRMAAAYFTGKDPGTGEDLSPAQKSQMGMYLFNKWVDPYAALGSTGSGYDVYGGNGTTLNEGLERQTAAKTVAKIVRDRAAANASNASAQNHLAQKHLAQVRARKVMLGGEDGSGRSRGGRGAVVGKNGVKFLTPEQVLKVAETLSNRGDEDAAIKSRLLKYRDGKTNLIPQSNLLDVLYGEDADPASAAAGVDPFEAGEEARAAAADQAMGVSGALTPSSQPSGLINPSVDPNDPTALQRYLPRGY